MKNITKVFLGATLSSFIVGGILYYNNQSSREVVAHGEYPYDITKKENVTESAKQVFVGKVIKKLEAQTDENDRKYTTYSVEVEESLKGELKADSEIVVRQSIGYDPLQKATIKMDEEDDYLEEGSSYVFATSNIQNKDIYQIKVPVKGNLKIKDKKDKLPNETILKEYKDAIKKNKEKKDKL